MGAICNYKLPVCRFFNYFFGESFIACQEARSLSFLSIRNKLPGSNLSGEELSLYGYYKSGSNL